MSSSGAAYVLYIIRTTTSVPYVKRKLAMVSTFSLEDLTRTTIVSILLLIQKWRLEEVQSSSIQNPRRPFVTLSFAQTLDGKIGLTSPSSCNYPISCKESLQLTHALRSIHDAILIGKETMRLDNPQLTVRYWDESGNNFSQPRPILLDTQLRTDFQKCRAKNLIVCCSEEAAASSAEFTHHHISDEGNSNITTSITLLPCATKRIRTTTTQETGKEEEEEEVEVLDLHDVLSKLYTNFGIQSIMVEGGAHVLSNFVTEELVDFMCITISPTILSGGRGLAAFSYSLLHAPPKSSEETMVPHRYSLHDIHWKQLGIDGILLGKFKKKNL